MEPSSEENLLDSMANFEFHTISQHQELHNIMKHETQP